jgi:hypothetical protein
VSFENPDRGYPKENILLGESMGWQSAPSSRVWICRQGHKLKIAGDQKVLKVKKELL